MRTSQPSRDGAPRGIIVTPRMQAESLVLHVPAVMDRSSCQSYMMHYGGKPQAIFFRGLDRQGHCI